MLVLRTQVVTVCTVVFGYWKDVQDNGLELRPRLAGHWAISPDKWRAPGIWL